MTQLQKLSELTCSSSGPSCADDEPGRLAVLPMLGFEPAEKHIADADLSHRASVNPNVKWKG